MIAFAVNTNVLLPNILPSLLHNIDSLLSNRRRTNSVGPVLTRLTILKCFTFALFNRLHASDLMNIGIGRLTAFNLALRVRLWATGCGSFL